GAGEALERLADDLAGTEGDHLLPVVLVGVEELPGEAADALGFGAVAVAIAPEPALGAQRLEGHGEGARAELERDQRVVLAVEQPLVAVIGGAVEIGRHGGAGARLGHGVAVPGAGA